MSERGRGERASERERESASSSRSPPRALVLLKHLQKQSRLLFFVVEKFRNLKWDARVCTICLHVDHDHDKCMIYMPYTMRHAENAFPHHGRRSFPPMVVMKRASNMDL